MSVPEQQILIADIGGTNARFALACKSDARFKRSKTFQCREYESLEIAMDAYLEHEQIEQLDAICFAAAGPVQDQRLRFTNNHWVVDMGQLGDHYNTKATRLLNDFEAISYSLPELNEDQLAPIGGSWDLPRGNDLSLGVLGPGSGLGVGGLIKHEGGNFYPLVTEAGHTGFSPENAYQLELLRVLFNKYNRVSNERLLSGPGLVNIYGAVCSIEGVASKDLDAKSIGQMGSENTDTQCHTALMQFFEILGQVAGDVALTQAAFDGVYIAGGIAQRYPDTLASSKFRYGFERKGRHSYHLENTPTWLVTESNPGLIGASSYALNFLN